MRVMKDFQDNGGIVLAILIVGSILIIGIGAIRAFDWLVWHRELKRVAKVASDDVGQHEIIYHEEELLQRATAERLTDIHARLTERIKVKKAREAEWIGRDRRMRA